MMNDTIENDELTMNIDKLQLESIPTAETTVLSPSSVGQDSLYSTPNSTTGMDTVTPGFEGYLTVGISPTSLHRNFSECEKAMKNDGILDMEFVQSRLVQRCIYFLYGKMYAKNDTPQKRVEKIKRLVSEKGNIDRLRSFALNGPEDRPMRELKNQEIYINLSIISDIFTRSENVVGGFPEMPFFRFQGNSASCYIASPCTWYSIQLQRDKPDTDEPNKVIDVAQYVRRNLFVTDMDIENRVLRNNGGYAFKLARDITGRDHQDWHSVPADDRDSAAYSGYLCYGHLKFKGFGLVTQFKCHPPFIAANLQKNTGLGYWLFDGNTDCKGTYVKLETPDDYELLREKYCIFFNNQKIRADEEHQGRRRRMLQSFSNNIGKPLFDCVESTNKNEETLPTNGTSTSTAEDSTAKHSMVMLACEKKIVNGQEKYFFMLVNTWEYLTLVVVSDEYLRSCGAVVKFLISPLTEFPFFNRKEVCMAECTTSDFYDGGDEEEEEVEYEIDPDDGDY